MPTRLPAMIFLTFICAFSHADAVDQFSWLAGCWAVEGGERGSVEMWTAPAAGTLLGLSRTVKDGESVAHEFMQIRDTGEALVFIAMPSKQPAATFRAIRTAEDLVVFENAQHDFPQRVIYRRISADAITARIEGSRNGTLRGIDYPMTRTKCESI